VASVYIVKRRISDDSQGRTRFRYHVKMQLGRYHPIVHLGSWDTATLAKKRRQAALEQLARGETPTRTPAGTYEPLNTTIEQLGQAWLDSRIDFAALTRVSVVGHLKGINARIGKRDPASITIADLRAWIRDVDAGDEDIQIATLRKRFQHLAGLLDYGGVDPNPVRARDLKFPRAEDTPKRLPRPSELARLYAALEPDPSNAQTANRGKNIPVVRLMEHTGVRIHEAVAVTWKDWDARRQRLLIPKSKTSAGTRLIGQVADHKHAAYARFALPQRPAGTPVEARIFPDVTMDSIREAMSDACVRAGIPRIRPHDLRHLHISRLLYYGILSPAEIAARAGHKSPDVTLKVYTHVIPPEDDDDHELDPRALTSDASTSDR
jgi:integrase